MSKELFVRAEEVAGALGISKPYAYKLVREMNEENRFILVYNSLDSLSIICPPRITPLCLLHYSLQVFGTSVSFFIISGRKRNCSLSAGKQYLVFEIEISFRNHEHMSQVSYRAVPIVAYASFVFDSLVVLVIAFAMPFDYTCVAIRRKENSDMAATRNLCAQIPIALHDQVCEAREQAGLTTAEYIKPAARIL